MGLYTSLLGKKKAIKTQVSLCLIATERPEKCSHFLYGSGFASQHFYWFALYIVNCIIFIPLCQLSFFNSRKTRFLTDKIPETFRLKGLPGFPSPFSFNIQEMPHQPQRVPGICMCETGHLRYSNAALFPRTDVTKTLYDRIKKAATKLFFLLGQIGHKTIDKLCVSWLRSWRIGNDLL